MAVDHGKGDATLGVTIGLRHLGLDDQPVALRRVPRTSGGTGVIHEGMADEAQVCASAGRLLVKTRLGIGDQGMGCVQPLLAAEVNFGIAIAGLFGGHRGGHGGGLGAVSGLVLGRGFGIGIGGGGIGGGGRHRHRRRHRQRRAAGDRPA